MFPLLLLAIFLSTLGLFWTGLHLFVESPLARRKMMTRLTAVQDMAVRPEERTNLLRKELLSDMPWLNRILLATPGILELRLFLQQGGIHLQVGTFVLLAISFPLFIFAATYVLGFAGMFCFLLAMGFAVVPFATVVYLRSRRMSLFDEQFPECIDLLGRSVRAGHAFTAGFELIGKEMSDPLGEEFRIAFRQQNLGLPMRDALANLAVRVPSPDVRIFVSALQIQRECGGNLGEILDTLSYVIRERFKLQRQVKIYTAEGRLSMYMLTGIPILTVIGLSLFKPGYLAPLLTDPRGHIAIAVVVVLQVIGYLVINKIIKIKV